jgi:adenylate cyclase
VAVFGLTFLQSFERWSQSVLCATVILGAAGIVMVLAILPDGFTYGTPGLLLVVMYACGAIRLLLRAAIVACAAILLLANAMLAYQGASAFQFVNTNVFLISASVIGLSYTALLEWTERHAFALEEGLREDKKASEAMLRNFLPDRIMSRLRDGERSIAEAVGEASVLFADVVGFTSLTHRMAPGHVVEILGDIFTRFDEIADRTGVEKVKTIGDCYMAVAGVRSPSPRSAEAMAEFAIEALAFVRTYAEENDLPLQVRVGMSTGSLVSGVIGTHVPIFDLWGGPVNDASRLQQEGVPGAIQVAESTYWRLRNRYEFQERGLLTLKHGEQINAYLLTGRRVAAGSGPRLVHEFPRQPAGDALDKAAQRG